MKASGWDERDAKLWSEINVLPSYGLIAGGDGGDRMISRYAVFELLKKAAKERFEAMHGVRCSGCGMPEGTQHRPSCPRQGLVTANSDYRVSGGAV